MDLTTLFVWAFLGGLFLAALGAGFLYYKTESYSKKQLSRDFILGTLLTGLLYPVLPESLNEIQTVLPSIPSLTADIPHTSGLDPGVQVGPANF